MISDINFPSPQVIEDKAKEAGIPIDKNGPRIIPQTGYSATKQGREECIRDPGECLPRRCEPANRKNYENRSENE